MVDKWTVKIGEREEKKIHHSAFIIPSSPLPQFSQPDAVNGAFAPRLEDPLLRVGGFCHRNIQNPTGLRSWPATPKKCK
jgi:hypothetical protein